MLFLRNVFFWSSFICWYFFLIIIVLKVKSEFEFEIRFYFVRMNNLYVLVYN